MTTAPAPAPAIPATLPDYISANRTIRSWLVTTDHKRIGILYMVSITLFFIVGGLAALLIRLELLTPASDLVARPVYNRLFTIHGVVMVWFFLIPSIPNVLGNFLIPMMIGARDLAFPRINLASWYLFMVGGSLALAAVVLGGVDTGWTFYPPYSSRFAQNAVFLALLGILTSGFSSIFTGLNFIVTIHTMRTPGLKWMRLPLFVWSHYATSLILVLATPVLAITLLLVAAERILGVGIFDPRIGGDPVLFQHFFWFYSHPAVYIMILPGFAVISEIIPCFSRMPIFGYRFIAFSSLAIALIGFAVWGHHMFVAGQSPYASLIFSIFSFIVAVPSSIKVFAWTFTLRRGRIFLKTPMIYALGFIGLFTIGGLTGLMLSAIAIDVHVHDTYFVVAHFHYIMVGGMLSAYLGGLHFWWPKMTGRGYPEGWGIFSAVLLFIGFNLTFFPQFIAGYYGMPRRYASYPEEYQVLNVLSTAGSSMLGLAYAIPLVYFLWSLRQPPTAPPNPWNARGLEWQTPSPPPTLNFTHAPAVPRKPYNYDEPGPLGEAPEVGHGRG